LNERRGSSDKNPAEVHDMDFVLVMLVGMLGLGRLLMVAYERTRAARSRHKTHDVLEAANEIVQAHERQLR
jgi:hypothetical protein